MKKRLRKTIVLSSIMMISTCVLFLVSCNKEPQQNVPNVPPFPQSTSSAMLGIWERADGQATTYLKIEETVATTCNNETETVGTFDSSVPSVTFVVNGTTHEFKMRMEQGLLILDVPPTSTNPNHVETEYHKYDTWPCGGSNGGFMATDINGNWEHIPSGTIVEISSASGNGIYKAGSAPSGAIGGNSLTQVTYQSGGNWEALNHIYYSTGWSTSGTLVNLVMASDKKTFNIGTAVYTKQIPISYKTYNIAVGYNPNDPYMSDINVNDLLIGGVSCGFTLLNSGVTSPDCSSSNSFYVISESQLKYDGRFDVVVKYTIGTDPYVWENGSRIDPAELTSTCNTYKFIRGNPSFGKVVYLVKM